MLHKGQSIIIAVISSRSVLGVLVQCCAEATICLFTDTHLGDNSQVDHGVV